MSKLVLQDGLPLVAYDDVESLLVIHRRIWGVNANSIAAEEALEDYLGRAGYDGDINDLPVAAVQSKNHAPY